MSKFHGMLLFDIADKPIGKWHENLGTRGMYDLWEMEVKGKVLYCVRVTPYDDGEKSEWEAWWSNEESGVWESIEFGTYKQCLKSAKDFMKKNKERIN